MQDDCKGCGQRLEFEAEEMAQLSCPNCGRGLNEMFKPVSHEDAVAKMRAALPGMIRTMEEPNLPATPGEKMAMWMMGALALAAVVWLMNEPTRAEKRALAAQRLEEAKVYATITNEVTQRLKAPRTAVWDGPEKLRWTDDAGGYKRKARGYVDSENGFGSLMRMEFEAEFYGNVFGGVRFLKQD